MAEDYQIRGDVEAGAKHCVVLWQKARPSQCRDQLPLRGNIGRRCWSWAWAIVLAPTSNSSSNTRGCRLHERTPLVEGRLQMFGG